MCNLPLSSDYVSLIGANDAALAQNKFTVSAELGTSMPLTDILAIELKQGYAGGSTGVNQTLAGTLYFFNSDPAIAAGTAIDGLTAAQINKIIGRKAVVAGDWSDLATGVASFAFYFDNAGVVVVPRLNDVYVAFLYTGAASINDGVGDDETLSIKVVYR